MLVPTMALNQASGPTPACNSLAAKTIATATVNKIITVMRGFASTKYSLQAERSHGSGDSVDFWDALDKGLLNCFKNSFRATTNRVHEDARNLNGTGLWNLDKRFLTSPHPTNHPCREGDQQRTGRLVGRN